MAKAITGLPEGFDIGVSSEDLAGPASLPGYLDEDPVVEFARQQKIRARESAIARAKEPASVSRPVPIQPQLEAAVVRAPEPAREKAPQASLPVPQIPSPEEGSTSKSARRRLQINLDPEGERMVEELLDLASDQSSEHRIKISEFVQALVLNLYTARSEISLASLPQRGRWGSPTAKSFPTALAEAFREAIVAHDRRIGGNPFKKAIGG